MAVPFIILPKYMTGDEEARKRYWDSGKKKQDDVIDVEYTVVEEQKQLEPPK